MSNVVLDISNQSVSSAVEEFQVSLEDCLAKIVSDLECDAGLTKAVSYALFPAGKRIRPLFSLLLCRDLLGDTSRLFEVVPALELMHSASLIHDDLPALDNDSVRRGKPSSHVAHGEAVAILAGDFMPALGFKLVSESSFAAEIKLEIVGTLSESYQRLCDGQVRDLDSEQRDNNLLEIYSLKTGALFGASAKLAALAANLDKELVIRVTQFGASLGQAFQLVDDYLDRFGSDKQRGRPGSSDERNARNTLFIDGPKGRGLSELKQEVASLDEQLVAIENLHDCLEGKCHGARWVMARIFERANLVRA